MDCHTRQIFSLSPFFCSLFFSDGVQNVFNFDILDAAFKIDDDIIRVYTTVGFFNIFFFWCVYISAFVFDSHKQNQKDGRTF